MEYLTELLKEKKQISLFSNFFPHVERLLDEEIARVSFSIFRYDLCADTLKLPKPRGDLVQLHEKVYIPKNEHPDYNFVGRILGPRGMTAKQLEQETGCKIMIRGKGSMRDRAKEESSRGKANYEHLDDELHVLIQCEDTKERAAVKLSNAAEQIRKLLVPPSNKGIDELKRKQLMELAIINGTYRPTIQSYNNNNSIVGGTIPPLLSTMSSQGTTQPPPPPLSGGLPGFSPTSPLTVSSPLSSASSGIDSPFNLSSLLHMLE